MLKIKQSFLILSAIALLLLVFSQPYAHSSVSSEDMQKAEKLFNWIEAELPEIFSPAGQQIQEISGIIYRYYPVSQSYLATYLGDFYLIYEDVHYLGTVNLWISYIPTQKSCPAKTLTWSQGQCRADARALNHNEVLTLNNQADGFSGSITVKCDNGNWAYHSGGTCSTSTDFVTTSGIEREILNQTNTQRRNNNRPTLARDSRLDSIARTYAMQIARDGRWGHWNFQARADQTFSLGFNSVGENEWKGTNISEPTNAAFGSRIITAWMNSKGHRENILKSDFTHIGIGFVQYGNYTAAVQFFGRKP